MGCNMKFKTKKQKLIHHNKMEVECKIERNSLVKLLKRFKELFAAVQDQGIYDVTTLDNHKNLKKLYEETERKLIDPDYFHCMLGKNFEDKCPDVDEDQMEKENQES